MEGRNDKDVSTCKWPKKPDSSFECYPNTPEGPSNSNEQGLPSGASVSSPPLLAQQQAASPARLPPSPTQYDAKPRLSQEDSNPVRAPAWLIVLSLAALAATNYRAQVSKVQREHAPFPRCPKCLRTLKSLNCFQHHKRNRSHMHKACQGASNLQKQAERRKRM